MDVSPARPYRDTATGDIVILTDDEFAMLGDDHPFRRVSPDEALTPAINPEAEIATADLMRMDDDGGDQAPPPAPRPGYAFEGGAPGRNPDG